MLQRLKILSLAFVVLVAIVLTSRTTYLELLTTPSDNPSGSILVWHSWPEEDAAALLGVVQTYTELHPDVKIVLSRVPPEDLLTRFEEAASIGFGPDLFLAPKDLILPLAQQQLILPVIVDESVGARFLPAALAALRYRDRLYGMPLTVHTIGLYYNRSLVDEPVASVDELMAAAQSGIEVGLSPSFENAYWGLRAFGGRLFNEEGRAILDQGGFANWLNWLKLAQDIPAFVLSSDQSALRTLFVEGQLGYLFDSSTAWDELSAGLDPSRIGVVPLPTGPTGSPAPLIGVEALLFSAASSAPQRALARNLAAFLTNVEQQTTLMRQTERIPANTRVRINARLSPVVASFAEQARSSVALPVSDRMAEIVRLGNEAYTRVLEGLITPADAAVEATLAINEGLGFAITTDDGYRCLSVGDFSLWHTWTGAQADALSQLVSAFQQDCPNIYVRLQSVGEGEIVNRLRAAAPGERPDLLLLPHGVLPPLIADSLIRPIGPLLTPGAQTTTEPDLLQRYRPLALSAFRAGERLYGLPVSVQTQALIYNAGQVELPARTLSDLLIQAEGGARLGLPLDFAYLYWGIPAFSTQPAAANSPVALDETALSGWLDWLQRAEQSDALVLTPDVASLDQQFIDGHIAYRVATADVAATLAATLGADVVEVATLPAGPRGEAGPLAEVNGFAISSVDETLLPALLEFMRYATGAEAQRFLVDTASVLPANATVDVTTHPLLAAYAEQLSSAVLYSNRAELTNLVAFGGDGYVWVRSGVLTPQQAAEEVISLIQQASGASAVVAEPIRCEGTGRVQVWSLPLDERMAAAFAEIEERFTAACAEITVEHKTASTRTELFAAVGALPEGEIGLVLGSGDWVADLSLTARQATTADQLAVAAPEAAYTPVDGFIDAAFIRTILPTAVDSVRGNGQILALPFSVNTTAIYINRGRIQTLPTSLSELLSEAQIGRRLALLTQGTQVLWGIGAFGGPPNTVADLSGTPVPPSPWPSEAALTDWFHWLIQAQRTPGVILGEEEDRSLSLFTNGRLAYFSGDAGLLPVLRGALGNDLLDVMQIPNGPGGAATPLLHSQAIYFPSVAFADGVEGEPQQAALSFALYLLGVEAQTYFMSEADLVPVNRLVDTTANPRIAQFVAQAATAIPYPTPQGRAFLALLQRVTSQVLDGEVTPEAAAARVLELSAQVQEP